MSRTRTIPWAIALALVSGQASGSNPYLEVPRPGEASRSPASRYANSRENTALAELSRRGVPYRRVEASVPGVRTPIRLSGPIRGVHLHSTLPEERRSTTPYEILDARLALALDDLCRILAAHGVVEVVHFTMYRPARGVGDRPQTRHPGGLAIDLGAMRKRDGTWLSVGPHWPEAIGSRTCGEGARKLVPRRGQELRSILCEANDQRLFHYMLSPHFNEAHGDHLHLEIKPGVRWFLAN